MKLLLIFLLPAFCYALVFSDITDAELHRQFSALSELRGKPYYPEEKAQMKRLVSRLLMYMRPTIKAQPGYKNVFMLSCSSFFNDRLEKVTCDVDFNPPATPSLGFDQRAFIRANIKQFEQSHVLRTIAYADWTIGASYQAQNRLYFRQSPHHTMTKSITPTLPVTPSASSNLSASATKSQPKSTTQSLPATASSSRSLSKSSSRTRTPTPMLYTGARTAPATGVNPGGLGAQDVPALTWELDRKGKPVMTWANAKTYCAGKGPGWRLPTIWELYTLWNQKSVLNGDYDQSWYWSSSPYAASAIYAWMVHFSGGQVDFGFVAVTYFVRCCRS